MIRATILRKLLLPAIEFCTASRFWTEYCDAARLDFASESRLQELRKRRLAALLNTACATRLHRERLVSAGISDSETQVAPEQAFDVLNRLAPIAKAELRRNFPDGVTTPLGSADRTYISTSGTTERLTVVADFNKRDARRSAGFHSLRIALNADVGIRCVEIPPNACNVVCGLEDGQPSPSLIEHCWSAFRRGQLFSRESRAEIHGWVERRLLQHRQTLRPISPCPADSLRSVLDERLTEATRERPTHLCALPQYLLWLADRMRARGVAIPSLQAVSPYGGLASPRMVDRIESGFGVPFRNLYGTNELGVIAASCGQSLHILDDMFVVEIMTEGRPVADGELGEIVVTDLHNTAMPLIRYRVGDVGRIMPGPCGCGRHTQRLEVLGRVQEMLETPLGPLPAATVADAFFQDAGVSNLRVEELAPGRFEASLVTSPDGPSPDLAACRDRFAALHGGVRQLTCRTAAYLQPETSGKYKLVLPVRRSVESIR
ncbi:MAG TPA: hypothetical protein VM165_10580 [Planctomycetaceae bacterium]|nr:hypothetical protein [Planctomycetaceae bacterium]